MARIKNKNKYPVVVPNLDDYFVGSKEDNNGKTVNYDFSTLIDIIKNADGVPTTVYKFSAVEDATAVGGYFNTNDDTLEFLSITDIVISKEDINENDMSLVLDNLVANQQNVVMCLRDGNSRYYFFKVTASVTNTESYSLTVESIGTTSIGVMQEGSSFVFSFIVTARDAALIEQVENNTEIINGLSNKDVDRIIVGGAFIWTEEDLVFQWSFYQYVLLGSVSYIAGNSGSPNLITLDAPDVGEVDDRIDLIAIDGISRDVIVLKGVPSPTPQEPTLVFGVQLRVTAIYVPANGSPIGITTEKVYDENLGDPAEWDVTNLLGTGVVSDDTTVGIPSDLYNIKFPSNLNVNQYEAITLTAGTPVTYDSGGALIFQLKQSERWESSTRLVIRLEDSLAAQIEIQLNYTSILPFGFDSANDDTWMTVAIPISSIDISSSALVDVSNITIEAHNHPVLYIDNIRYQTGIGTPFVTTTVPAIVKLNEGNGIGYVVEGSDRTLFGNIGQNALDLSLSTGVSTTRGATGTHSVALGDDVTASGYGSFACGYGNTASGDLSFIQGYTNSSGGYSDAVYGTFNTSTGPSNDKGYRFIAGLRNTVDVTLGGIALGNGHWVSSFGTTAVGQASLQTSGGANADTSPMLVVGNGDFNYNVGGLNVTTRSNAFVVYKSGSVVAPSLTTALIDGEGTGKSLITKEWITAQGFGDYVDLINPQSVYGIKTFYDNLYVNQFGNTGVATFGIGAVQQLYNYTTNDFTILNSSGRFIVNGSGKYLQVDATGFSIATDSTTDQRGYLLTDNLTGQQTLQYPDNSGTLPLSVNGEVADAAGNITIYAVTNSNVAGSSGIGSRTLNWGTPEIVKFGISASGNMTFSDTNLPAAGTYQKKEIYITGDTGSTATFPAYWQQEENGESLSFPSLNRVTITCLNSTALSEEIYYRIDRIKAI